MINAFKAPASVGTMGGVIGSIIPGVGTAAGIGIGAGTAYLLNSPKFQSRLSKFLDKSSTVKTPKTLSTFRKLTIKGTKEAYTFSKFASRAKEDQE